MRTATTILTFCICLLAVAACDSSAQPPTSTSAAPTSTIDATGTTTTPPSAATDTTTFCTEIGCDSVLTIELSEVDLTPEATYTVDICVDNECATESITIDVPDAVTGEIIRGESERRHRGRLDGWMMVWPDGDYIDYYLPEGEYGDMALVAFTLTDAEGEVLAQTENEEAPLERSQPNGPDCPPICFWGTLTV